MVRKKIIIDASSYDEIRVAITENGMLSEFDHEFKDSERIKGNIYLAIVRHIEPSLQAVFVEYEVGKHGFLPFSEISPEYYSLGSETKQHLISAINNNYENFCKNFTIDNANNCAEDRNYSCINKRFKLKEVIRAGQMLVVQATKDERGTKGASFTTYILVSGRFITLRPNAGMKMFNSKKFNYSNVRPLDYKFDMKDSLPLLSLRKNIECGDELIKNDIYYLAKLWNSIKLKAKITTKCSILYVDLDILRRTIRDKCGDDVSEIVVSGSSAYKKVYDYFRSFYSSGAKIKKHNNVIPIFNEYGIEDQLLKIYESNVALNSGGFLVISQTEALVSVDVNSGKMTAENSLEETAYKTNIEAAREIVRQVKIRGLSGLIVIDFIDMSRYKYCRDVEFVVKNAFKSDSAKVQISNIGSFGLMAISRQRISSSVFESSMLHCKTCSGTGRVRSFRSISTNLIRDLRFIAIKNKDKEVTINSNEVIMQDIINNHRKEISSIEDEYSVVVVFDISQKQEEYFSMNVSGTLNKKKKVNDSLSVISGSESLDYEKLLKLGNSFWISTFFKRIWVNGSFD